MERTECESSLIASRGYDPGSQTLEIEFKRGGVYQYFSFTPSDWEAFLAADSVGKHFLRNIKSVFEYQKVG